MKYVAEIPARLGSKRVKQKNLRMILDKPMIAYAIEACKGSQKLTEIFVNTESYEIGKVAKLFGAKHYLRSEELSQDHIVSDQFNFEFLSNTECDAVVMVNPVSPLVLSEDIDAAIKEFESENLDTLISIREEKLQSFYKNEAINFDVNELLPMTQNLSPIQLCVWTVCIWRKETFLKAFNEKGHAVFHGKIGFYPIDPLRSIKISEEHDFKLAEALLRARQENASEAKFFEIDKV